ncbi:MAG TPA: ribosome small subunit-dependent GTPase A [Candidatus Cloacimonadota bacterium]|nr:ribosome small subunit-dependent GTPase A [Candidatus Cloacimonadota bacterium]HOV16500.1 ribosome small subunit-dependent GTPase A [Candidatus Cloacimonadota bacterium]HQL15253.1 ribosome small subunit-dependent GTPase A [Candidatus Cloacimonadota bacterium]
MKQKDKKKIIRRKERLYNVSVQDEAFYDEFQKPVRHKAKRAAHKSAQSYKSNLILQTGRVVEVKSNYLNIVRIGEEEFPCKLSGRLKQFALGTKVLTAVGDWVKVDFSQAPDLRIEEILPRRNTLSRYTEDAFQKQIIVACNLDILVITASWRQPLLKLGLVDRYLCVSAINNLQPVICLNKIDLCDNFKEAEQSVQYYKKLDIPVIFTSAITRMGIEELKSILAGKDSVFSGQSGTGKSSIINCLEPGLNLAVREVSDYNEKGRHTTSQARLIKWSFGGNLADTPGLKTINLHKEQKNLIPFVFPGFDKWTDQCYFRSCTHSHEEDCAVKEAVQKSLIPVERYESYLRIMESL